MPLFFIALMNYSGQIITDILLAWFRYFLFVTASTCLASSTSGSLSAMASSKALATVDGSGIFWQTRLFECHDRTVDGSRIIDTFWHRAVEMFPVLGKLAFDLRGQL